MSAERSAGHLVYDADCDFCSRSAHWLDNAPVAWHTLDLDRVHVTRAEADVNAGWLVEGRITALGAEAISTALRAKRGVARVAGWAMRVPGIRSLAAWSIRGSPPTATGCPAAPPPAGSNHRAAPPGRKADGRRPPPGQRCFSPHQVATGLPLKSGTGA